MKLTNGLNAKDRQSVRIALENNSISELITKEYFEPTGYPKRADYIAGSKCKCCGSKTKHNDDAGFRDAMAAYRERQQKLVLKFRYALMEFNGIAEEFHPAAVQKTLDMAWSYGHSAGLHEVQSYFEDLLDIILCVK